MKIVLVVGTRPQIIKSQPIINEIRSRKIDVFLIHTGQHYDYLLSKSFFKELEIPTPDLKLNIKSSTPANQLSAIISKLEKPLSNLSPDLVIVPGDTTSALGASLTASKLGLKIAHVESGVRDNQTYMQEEINRRLIDHCSHLLFAPTKTAYENLKNEHTFGKKFFVGDTMYDLFKEYFKKYKLSKLKKRPNENQIFMTLHRRENVDNQQNLKKISKLVNELGKNYQVIFPVHPHTRKKIREYKINLNAKLIEPTKYLDTLKHIAKSKLVITDSGGLQKEVYWMGKPCITLLEKIGWVETEKEQANFAFPLSKPFNIQKIKKILSKEIIPKNGLFGYGNASNKIASIIIKQFKLES